MEWIDAEKSMPVLPCITVDVNGNRSIPNTILRAKTDDGKEFAVDAGHLNDDIFAMSVNKVEKMDWSIEGYPNRIKWWMPFPELPKSNKQLMEIWQTLANNALLIEESKTEIEELKTELHEFMEENEKRISTLEDYHFDGNPGD